MSISRSGEQAFTTLRFFSAKLAIVASGALLGLPAESDEVEDSLRLVVKNEIESGHTMLGRIVTMRPRWVLDACGSWQTATVGRWMVGVWNASDWTHDYDPSRKMWFNEVDPRVGYGYTYEFTEGWSLDSQLEFQWSEMRYPGTPRTYTQWIATETLRTPWVDVYGFNWTVTHPYRAPAYRLGVRKDIPVYEQWRIEPNVYFDLGPARWNRRRFGSWTADRAHYSDGVNAGNVHFLLKYIHSERCLFYAGVRHIDSLGQEVRRQQRANRSQNARCSFTYFVLGVISTF